MAKPARENDVREARIFRNNKSQAIRIPADFELDCTSVRIRREGHQLIIEPIEEKSIITALSELEPLGPEDELPDVKEGLLPAKSIDL